MNDCTGLFDSHAHYFDERFIAESEGADVLLQAVFSAGMAGILNVGTNPENSVSAMRQASVYPQMYAAVGLHPTDCQTYEDPDVPLAKIASLLSGRTREQKIIALGEIGLDYHYEDTDRVKQRYVFEQQLELARRQGIPVIIHDRDAHGDCFDAVCRYPDVRGVFHSYSGSAEMARDLVRRGWYISFSGVATYPSATRVREAIAAVPPDRLLIETDCPYLPPVPHRGQLNHSGYLYLTAAAVAAASGMPVDLLIRQTTDNAGRLFAI